VTSLFLDYAQLLRPALAQARATVLGETDVADKYGLSKYAEDPVGFSVNVLGHKQWAAQKYTQRALIKHRYVAVSSCRSASKSWTGSETLDAMTCTAPTISITTAPTFEQVKRLTWGPLAESHMAARVPLPGKLNLTELRIGPRWYAVGLSTNDPDNMQGFHSGRTLSVDCEDPEREVKLDQAVTEGAIDAADRAVHAARKNPTHRLFVLLDECPGIDPRILETLAGSFAADNVFVLAQGNPTFVPDSDHPFARWWKKGSRFHRVHIAYAPFPAEWEPEPADMCFHAVPDEINKGICANIVKEHGLQSAFARCHAFGLPAAVELERQFISLNLLLQQDENEIKPDPRSKAVHMGWDVAASEEGDWNVLSIWINGLKRFQERWRRADTMDSVTQVVAAMRKYGQGGEMVPASNVHVDATGVGKPCVDRLREIGYWVDAVDFGSAPVGDWARSLTGQTIFANRKAELIWVLRRAMQEGIARIPRTFEESWRQAQWQTYKDVPRAGGTALAVAEKKDDLRKLYGRSPDEFDADCLAWSRGMRRMQVGTIDGAGRVKELRGG
jgi:hypothetical protein